MSEPDGKKNGPWILLAEDDKLFAMLFSRAWKHAFPDVPIFQVTTVSELSGYTGVRDSMPCVAVLDLNLEDGTSLDVRDELACPNFVWSSDSHGEVRQKPLGKSELAECVVEIARLGGLSCASNRGSTGKQKE